MPRRRVVAGLATFAGLGAGLGAAIPVPASAKTTLSPDRALDQLMQGNGRFVAAKLQSFNKDLPKLRAESVAGQAPFAAVLACADSRVPVELAFDQTLGHIFVTRVAGNICTPDVIASLEYAAGVLGTPLIVVMGHSGCGAVKATVAGEAVPGQISALFAPIRPAVERAGPNVDAVVRANAEIQADILRTASPVVAGLTKQGKLKVVAAYYDLGSGAVTLLG